jgi:hypothetical protein
MRYKGLILVLAIAFACQSGNIFARGGRHRGRGRRVEQKMSGYKVTVWTGRRWIQAYLPVKMKGNPSPTTPWSELYEWYGPPAYPPPYHPPHTAVRPPPYQDPASIPAPTVPPGTTAPGEEPIDPTHIPSLRQ